MFKKLLAFLMITVMMFSASVVTFAEEIDENAVSVVSEDEVDFNTDNYSYDTDKIIEDMRSVLAARTDTITIKLAADVKYNAESIKTVYTNWIESALEHTGKANEGDYIRCHLSGYETDAITLWSKDGKTYYYVIPFKFHYFASKKQEETVTEKIADLINGFGFTEKTTDKQKCDKIYDYITSTVKYDNANLNNPNYTLKFSAYAALINKTAVCQGYASLFYRLALECGLDTRVVTGYANGEMHAWNIVKLGNYYYHLDSTWDSERTTYKYYLKGSSVFTTHTLDSKFKQEEFVSKYPISKISYSENGENSPCVSGHTFDNACDAYCNVCGESRTVVHEYKWVIVTQENCGFDGEKYEECTLCGGKRNENTLIPATGNHVYDDAVDTVCNVCNIERELEYDQKLTTDQTVSLKYVSDQDVVFVSSDEEIAKITKVSTTISEDKKVTQTATVTPFKPGYVVIQIKTLAGEVLAETVLYIVEGEHQMQLGTVIKEANCAEGGKVKYICKFCGFEQEVATDKKDHVFDNDADSICNLCGYDRKNLGEQLVKDNGTWYYYVNGVKSDATTLVKANGKWLYVENGIWTPKTGLVFYKDKWFYVYGGKWFSNTTDLKKVDGKWYYIQNGKWNQKIDTLHKINGKWFLIKKGMWNKTTGIVEYKGKDFFVQGGKWKSLETLYKKSGKYLAIKGGKWFKDKGIVKYNGKKYYVNKGYAQTSYSGKVTISGKKYTVKKGIIK